MYWKNKVIILLACISLLTGCSTGFLGFAPMGDRKEYSEARDLYNQGNYEQAITHLNAYIYKTKNVKRREARAYRLLGESYEQLGQLNKALEIYLEALEFHPDNVPLLVSAARLYQTTGLLDQAQELYEKALQKEPEDKEVLAGLAHNYHLLGFNSKSQEIYHKFFAQNTETSPLYRARYAQTFLDQRNYKQVALLLAPLLQEKPNEPDFWLLSARAAYGLNNISEALADLDTALRLTPHRRDLLATKALWLYQDKQYDLSLQTAEQILKDEPNNQLALLVQVLNWYKQGKTTKANKQLKQIVQLDGNSFVGQVAAKMTMY